MISRRVLAISIVRFSWICKRLEKWSTIRAILRKTEDFSIRDISNMALSKEGKEVMLTKRVELDIFYNDHFISGGTEKGAIDEGIKIFMVAACQCTHCFGTPFWSFDEALPFWVLSNLLNNLPKTLFHGEIIGNFWFYRSGNVLSIFRSAAAASRMPCSRRAVARGSSFSRKRKVLSRRGRGSGFWRFNGKGVGKLIAVRSE